MAEPRNYRANAAATPPDPLSTPSTGYPATEVPGETDPTYPGEYWYYQVGEELRKAIIEGGLTPKYDTVDQLAKVLGKVFGRTNNGDPNGSVAADRVHERCWDTSRTPAVLYIATVADGTVGGTVWRRGHEMMGLGVPLRGYIDGLELSNNSSDSTHDIDIGAGVCVMRNGAGDRRPFELSGGLTKQIDVNWLEGTGAGGFPSGLTISPDTHYNVILIGKDDGTVDAGFDTDASASNLLSDASSYSWFRRIGSVWTDGSSNIIGFRKNGDYFEFLSEQQDVDDAGVTAGTEETASVSVPPGQRGVFFVKVTGNSCTSVGVVVRHPDLADETSIRRIWVHSNDSNSTRRIGGYIEAGVDGLSQVSYRGDIDGAGGESLATIEIVTVGWIDDRGRND